MSRGPGATSSGWRRASTARLGLRRVRPPPKPRCGLGLLGTDPRVLLRIDLVIALCSRLTNRSTARFIPRGKHGVICAHARECPGHHLVITWSSLCRQRHDFSNRCSDQAVICIKSLHQIADLVLEIDISVGVGQRCAGPLLGDHPGFAAVAASSNPITSNGAVRFGRHPETDNTDYLANNTRPTPELEPDGFTFGCGRRFPRRRCCRCCAWHGHRGHSRYRG